LRSIGEGVERVRAYLRAEGVSGERLDGIEERLEYLEGAAHRCGRRDWQLLAVTLLWDVVLQASINPERAQEMLETFHGGIAGLLGG
jgi:hypothetical protein